MALAAFTEFVAEQAVAITIGVAAVLVAPKVGPKLAQLSSDLTAGARSLKGDPRMTCNFNFKVPNDPIAIIDMVRPLIVNAGGTVTGESANVSFSIPTAVGRFDGACTLVEASVVNIAVTDKPDLVPCTVIRERLTFFITEAVKMYRQQSKVPQPDNGATAHA